MNDNIKYRCEIIRQMNDSKRRLLLKDGLLESMPEITLETIRDYESKIEQILMSYSDKNKKIEKIRWLMEKPHLRIQVEKMMEGIGAEKIEDLGMFSDTILRILLEIEGQTS